MSSLSKPWLDKAADDLTVGRLVLSEGHRAHACFLGQHGIPGGLPAGMPSEVKAQAAMDAADKMFRFVTSLIP